MLTAFKLSFGVSIFLLFWPLFPKIGQNFIQFSCHTDGYHCCCCWFLNQQYNEQTFHRQTFHRPTFHRDGKVLASYPDLT